MILPLATARFFEWLRVEVGSPPITGIPVLTYDVEADPRSVEQAASSADAGVFTSPTAVDVLSSMLPGPSLAKALARAYAIGPMTASAIASAASKVGVSPSIVVPSRNDSQALAAALEDGPRYALWCSADVSPHLERRVVELGGVVVRLYDVRLDGWALEIASRALGSGSVRLVVMTSSSSIDAWLRLRGAAAAPVAAVVISRRLIQGLAGDPMISHTFTYGGDDIRGFPAFLSEVYRGL